MTSIDELSQLPEKTLEMVLLLRIKGGRLMKRNFIDFTTKSKRESRLENYLESNRCFNACYSSFNFPVIRLTSDSFPNIDNTVFEPGATCV